MRISESPNGSRSKLSRLRVLAAGLILSCVVVPATIQATASRAAAETQVIGGPGSFAQPGMVNLNRTGYTGTRSLLDYQYCTQWAGQSTGTPQTARFVVFRTSNYSSSRQTITMHLRRSAPRVRRSPATYC